MFHMPMSSPMMKRMLGFVSAACAATATNAAHNAATHCMDNVLFHCVISCAAPGFVVSLRFDSTEPWKVSLMVTIGRWSYSICAIARAQSSKNYVTWPDQGPMTTIGFEFKTCLLRAAQRNRNQNESESCDCFNFPAEYLPKIVDELTLVGKSIPPPTISRD